MVRNNGQFDKEVIGYFAVWFGSVLIYLFLASSLLPKIIQGSPVIEAQSWTSFWKSFANWDGGHYLGISQNGYLTKYQYAFFPLYPLLIRVVAVLTGNYLVSALIISWSSLLLALLILTKLLILDFSKEMARKGIIYLLVFPTSIFLITAYSESLFLLLAVSAFYFFRKRRWLLASSTIAIASATRPVGIVLILPLVFEYLASRDFKIRKITSNVLVLTIAPFGLLLYMLYLQQVEGNPFIFITAQTHWQRLPALPITTLYQNYLDVASLNNIGMPFFAQQSLNFAAVIFALCLSVVSFFRLRQSYFIFISLATILPLTTTSTVSFTRLILPLFPVYMILAIWGQNKVFHLFWLILSTMLFSLVSLLFINGYWIA